ncbi:MAG: hypothetical protein ACRD1E_08660, partial [Terriglobales bacterium]
APAGIRTTMGKTWLAAAVVAVAMAAMAAGARAQHLVMPASTVVPAAHIELELGRDGNGNTTVDLKADHLAQPSGMTPSAQTYMVWVQAAAGTPERKGMLQPDNDLNAELNFVTPAQHFELFITAEPGPQAAAPTGAELVRAAVARSK